MEQMKNFEAEVKELIPAIGFIKTRKLESIAMDMAENLQKEAEKKGYLLLETFVDSDGNRDIDREQLDEIYEIMRENDMSAILRRLNFVFRDKIYRDRVDKSDKRWLDAGIDEVFAGIEEYLNKFI